MESLHKYKKCWTELAFNYESIHFHEVSRSEMAINFTIVYVNTKMAGHIVPRLKFRILFIRRRQATLAQIKGVQISLHPLQVLTSSQDWI